jgi:uncharacterized membrane protein (DUF4010 family)
MSENDQLQRTALAAMIGLLIGIERGWQEREAQDGARVAGIRTFTLIAILGALGGLLAGSANYVLIGFCFVGFALPFSLFEYRQSRASRSHSITDFVTGLLTFALGAYTIRGNMAIAAAVGVTTTAILAERRVMHAFLRRLKWQELRAAIFLLVMTAVLLPALPDRTIDPWNALNPHQIWLMTVLIGIISYAGYIAIRLAGERKGLLYAGLMGGLITSTTITWTFARIAKRDRTAFAAVLAAILGAWIVSLVRMGLIAISIAPQLASGLLPPVTVAAGVLLVPAIIAYLRPSPNRPASGLVLRDPFELSLMLKFLVVLIVIMLLSKTVLTASGSAGMLSLGGLSGLLDVDPITLSMANMVREGAAVHLAVQTILLAAVANATGKTVLGAVFGGAKMGVVLAALMLAAAAGGVFTYLA